MKNMTILLLFSFGLSFLCNAQIDYGPTSDETVSFVDRVIIGSLFAEADQYVCQDFAFLAKSPMIASHYNYDFNQNVNVSNSVYYANDMRYVPPLAVGSRINYNNNRQASNSRMNNYADWYPQLE
jgi:hypothetical protein